MAHRTIDQSIVVELKELADADHPTFFLDQVRLFSQRGRMLLEGLQGGIGCDDPERARAAAHALAGSAAVVGASRLTALCQKLEEQCGHWRRGPAEAVSDQIKEEFGQAERLLLGEACDVYIEVERLGRKCLPHTS